MDAIHALKNRRSIRRFAGGTVPREVIEDCVDCARLAPSARNVQPWAFVVVTDADVRTRLAEMCPNGPFLADAPVAVVVLCEATKYYLEDGAAATTNLLNAAYAHGLGACWVAGDKKDYAGDVCRLVGAPEDYTLIALIALGPADLDVRPPAKKNLENILHWGSF